MANDNICPSCGHKGHHVDSATVKALLAVSLRHVRDIGYRFCATPNCETVYYSEDGAQTFAIHEVRERVYQKEPQADDVLICYCFQHTPGAIRQHVAQSTQARILEDIASGIEAGQCACDWRNPQGNCCLGNVRQLIKQLDKSHV